MTPELRGQTVVVIGGSSGIGLETAGRARAWSAVIQRLQADEYTVTAPSSRWDA